MAIDLTPAFLLTLQPTLNADPQTVCGWVRTSRVPSVFNAFWVFQNDDGFYSLRFFNDAGSARLIVNTNDSNRVNGPVMALDTWVFFGLVRSGTSLTFRYRLEGQSTLTTASGTVLGDIDGANPLMRIGAASGTAATGLDGAVAYFRTFSAALTETQLLDESASTAAVATEWADWPLADTATMVNDVSGNGRNLNEEESGAVANAANPDISLEAPVGAIAETDALLAAQRSTSTAVGVVAETDAFVAPLHQHSVTVGQLTELDALAAGMRSHGATSAALAEVDTFVVPARTSSRQAGALTETDELLAIGEATEVAAIAETDTLVGADHTSTVAVGALTEGDLLNPASRSTTHQVGVATEADAIAAAARTTGHVVGLLSELDVLLGAGEVEEVGALLETDALLPVGHVSTRGAGSLTELDVLLAAGEEVLGRLRFISRARPLVSAGSGARPTVDMEVTP